MKTIVQKYGGSSVTTTEHVRAATSLTGPQAGMKSTGRYGSGMIPEIRPDRLLDEGPAPCGTLFATVDQERRAASSASLTLVTTSSGFSTSTTNRL